ncbi:MAG: M24 family metallopeptidase [Acidobacteria bacterium]|nr:MAG: M24 family metallopeptidase [Acidobacteriota bacterium]
MNTTTDQLIEQIQSALNTARVPGWLFYGFHANDPIALSILRFGPAYHATRRWFYLVPAEGEPVKLVHRIESGMLDHLPGRKLVYLRWQELRSQLAQLLGSSKTVAMQYSPENAVPYVSKIDAGTVELVRACGAEVVSSADLVQQFETRWTADQVEQHRATADLLTKIVNQAFQEGASALSDKGLTTEFELQRFIQRRFEDNGLICDSPPIVGVNGNAGNPHYCPSESSHSAVRKGDFLLIDLWAKPLGPDAVYADITWTAFYGKSVPSRVTEVFDVVRRARDRGVEFLKQATGGGRYPQGWEVDDAVREVIRVAGYADKFVHRTGHSLGREVHGNGVNFDNLETHDTRSFLPGVACTIEPGIYLDDFGVRSEINVIYGKNGPEVTTSPQDSLLVFPL